MVHLKSFEACQRCPGAMMCLAGKPLTDMTPDVSYCPSCFAVWFRENGESFICTLIRAGRHAPPNAGTLVSHLIERAVYGDNLDQPRRRRVTSVCRAGTTDCTGVLRALGVEVEDA